MFAKTKPLSSFLPLKVLVVLTRVILFDMH